MKKQHKQYATAVGVLVVVLAVFWLAKTKPANAPEKSESQTTTPAPQPTAATEANVWHGTLKASNNGTKGSLMLVTTDRTIYIRTSRDFSDLINKKVRVTYSGTLQSFVLGGITLDEQK